MQAIRLGILITQLHKVEGGQFLQINNLKFYRVMKAFLNKIMLNMVVQSICKLNHSLEGAFYVFLVKILQRTMAVYFTLQSKAA
jgi:hypothetical protein